MRWLSWKTPRSLEGMGEGGVDTKLSVLVELGAVGLVEGTCSEGW